MRTRQFSILLLLTLIPVLALAGEIKEKGKYTKEKKISKSYSVNSNVWLGVTNKYGNVYVTTWDQNTTALDIVITVSGNSEDKVKQRLNSIDIDINASKDKVSAITNIGNFNGSNISMEINYTIKIPKQGAVNINNQYGGIITGKIYGESYLVSKYGDLKIDELNNRKNLIDIEYCDAAKIGNINNAKILAKYSDITIGNADFINIDCDYTDVVLQKADDVNYTSNYGDIHIVNAGQVFGVGNYLNTKIGNLSRKLNLASNYGDITILGIASSVNSIVINTTYTTTKLAYTDRYAFDFEISLKYGDLNGTGGMNFSRKEEKGTSSYYKGYNQSSGKNTINISGQYSDIKLVKQ